MVKSKIIDYFFQVEGLWWRWKTYIYVI